MPSLKTFSVILAVGALFTGLVGAYYWYLSSKVPIDPGWANDPLLEPVIAEQRQAAWTVAFLNTTIKASRLNKTASIWTAVSVFLSASSAVVGSLS